MPNAALPGLSRSIGLMLLLGAASVGGGYALGMVQSDAPSAGAEPVAHPARRGAVEEALPAWFGRPELPRQRIAGRLVQDVGGAPVAGTVHLRIDAPDATVWPGLDLETGPDGWFDFGELRVGRYDLFAVTPGETSRSFLVENRDPSAAAVRVELAACTTFASAVGDAHGVPVAGAQLDISGVHVATTDAAGRFRVCFLPGSAPPVVRAPGYAAEPLALRDGVLVRDVRLADSVTLHGHVTGADGRPAAGVSVQPMNVRDERESGTWIPLPVQATTDAHGDFAVSAVPARDHVFAYDQTWCPEMPARYGFHVIIGADEVYDQSSVIAASARRGADVHMATPPPVDEKFR